VYVVLILVSLLYLSHYWRSLSLLRHALLHVALVVVVTASLGLSLPYLKSSWTCLYVASVLWGAHVCCCVASGFCTSREIWQYDNSGLYIAPMSLTLSLVINGAMTLYRFEQPIVMAFSLVFYAIILFLHVIRAWRTMM
jgi:hypothetical protein